jgi:hypothetical protein
VRLLNWWVTCMCLAVAVPFSRAEVLLYDYLQNNNTSFTGSGYTYNAWQFRDTSAKMAQRIVTQVGGNVLTQIKVNLWTWPYNPGTFTVDIYSDNSNSVGTKIVTAGTRDISTISSSPPGTMTPATFSGLNISLSANTSYWVVVEGDTAVIGNNMYWGLGGSGSSTFVSNPTTAARYNDYNSTWSNLTIPALGMQVTASVPEPGTLLLGGLASLLGGGALWRKRRTKRVSEPPSSAQSG